VRVEPPETPSEAPDAADEPTAPPSSYDLGEEVRRTRGAAGAPPATVIEGPGEYVPRLKSGVDAREASRLGHEARALQRIAREARRPGDDIRYLRVPVNAAATVRKLATEAQRGSTHASRELRAWMDLLDQDDHVTVSDLDVRTRQRLLQRLMGELRDEDEAAQPGMAPGIEGDAITPA